MTKREGEEELLHSGALQSAQSIQAARQRAEHDLLQVKEALEHKTSELANSLAMLRAALEATADGIIATDSKGTITGFNEQYLRMWRISRELAESHDHRKLIEFVSSQFSDPVSFKAQVEQIYRFGPHETSEVLYLSDGRVYERVSKVQLVENQNVGRVWSFRDITEHVRTREQLAHLNENLKERVKQRTAELQQSETQFQQLVLGVTDCAIFMLDVNGQISTWNLGAERIKGYSAAEVLGRHFSIFYTDEDRARGLPQLALEKAANKGKFEAESWRVRKDGTRFWASVLIDPILDANGTLIGYAKITRDMTDRRAMQEQLHQSQKMEAIGHLTGGVAHDFNNLLTVILGNLETIARRLPAQEAKLQGAVDQASRGAQRAATLTQQLLAFSRRQPLNPKPTDVNRLVSGMSDLIRRTLSERIAIETVLGAGLWRAEVDAHQLESALLNLAVNARDAMPERGKLTIETTNAYLDEGYTATYQDIQSGQYVLICVSDTGTGMSSDVIARAFDPFFTTKPIGEGTGLGLSQVYGFIKQSGGHVKLYSEPGEGTTVKLYLPRYTGTAIEKEREAQPVIPTGRPEEVILVVEDDEDVRSYSTESLRELGFTVLEAHDGHSALQVLDHHPEIQLLFTDVGLPGINGRELVDRARTRRPALKVLFTSGYARNAIVHQGRLDHGVELLTKPFTRAQLAMRVRAVFDARTSSLEHRYALIVEDEVLVRMFLSQTVEQLGFKVLEAGTAAQAKAILEAHADIRVAFIDIGLPDENGLELAKQFRIYRPSMPLVIASGYGQQAIGELTSDEKVSSVSKPYDSTAVHDALQALGIFRP